MSAWRENFPAKPAAQALADRLHAWLIANNAEYAFSVRAGQTLRWAFPYQDVDTGGNVIGSTWAVNIKDRCYNALSAPEKVAASTLSFVVAQAVAG